MITTYKFNIPINTIRDSFFSLNACAISILLDTEFTKPNQNPIFAYLYYIILLLFSPSLYFLSFLTITLYQIS